MAVKLKTHSNRAMQLDRLDLKSEISHIHLEKLQPQAIFLASLRIVQTIRTLLVVKKAAGSGCCKMQLQNTEEKEEEEEGSVRQKQIWEIF